jgi:effector-binding domain-containing protein
MDVFRDEPGNPERFFSLDPKGKELKAAGLYMVGYARGSYGETQGLPKRMAVYAKKNKLLFNGPVYKTYLFSELCVTDPEQYLMQVCASVLETRRMLGRRPNHQHR